jgi:hypothetical protein
MKAKHHFWSSVAVGGLLYSLTHSYESFIGTMLGGFFIDADHVVDQLWSIYEEAPHNRKSSALAPQEKGFRGWLAHYIRRRKLVRMPLIFHSYELIIVLTALTIYLRTPFLIGLLVGYVLHISLDLYRHHNEFRSSLFYSLLYRLAKGCRRDSLIKGEYR